jgi:hypothetical protein
MSENILHVLQNWVVTHKWDPNEMIETLVPIIGEELVRDLRRAVQETVFVALNIVTRGDTWMRILHLAHEVSIGDDLSEFIQSKIWKLEDGKRCKK